MTPQATVHNLSVVVIVGGRAVDVTVNSNQRVKQLMREALHEAKLRGANVDDWDLRSESGQLIDRHLAIQEAGIAAGATLYLDPSEGGGGSARVLVDHAISRRKLDEQLDQWQRNADRYRTRGQLLLSRDDLQVDVAFAARLPVGRPPGTPLVAVCARIRGRRCACPASNDLRGIG